MYLVERAYQFIPASVKAAADKSHRLCVTVSGCLCVKDSVIDSFFNFWLGDWSSSRVIYFGFPDCTHTPDIKSRLLLALLFVFWQTQNSSCPDLPSLCELFVPCFWNTYEREINHHVKQIEQVTAHLLRLRIILQCVCVTSWSCRGDLRRSC